MIASTGGKIGQIEREPMGINLAADAAVGAVLGLSSSHCR